jgi:serine/threonine protein kinase
VNTRVEEVFHNVADLSLEARSRYFSDHGVEGDTRREVEALLVFDSGKSDILLRDISAAASRALPQLEMNGWFCGPYRLLQLIGRGGMGAVYLAERADGEVTQRLAVKVLPPGAGASQHERFLKERQILASLVHRILLACWMPVTSTMDVRIWRWNTSRVSPSTFSRPV